MSKTTKPLTIAVDREWIEHPKIRELMVAGHTVFELSEVGADLILSRKAHFWDESFFEQNLLSVAIKRARERKTHGTDRRTAD